jgi:hypothetical protein
LEQVCVPLTIWWPGQRAGSPPEIPVARAQARLEWLDESGPLAPLDRADDLAREVAALAITLQTSLIKSAVRDVLDR